MAVRHMARAPWPGFEVGGVAWFADLTLPAVQCTTTSLAAPMGSYGIVLPASVALLMFLNLQLAFSRSPAGTLSIQTSLTTSLDWTSQLFDCRVFDTATCLGRPEWLVHPVQ